MARRLISWSGGKDSAWCLLKLQEAGETIDGLVTAVHTSGLNQGQNLPLALLRRQAGALGLPLYEVQLPEQASNAEWIAAWSRELHPVASGSGDELICGDLFLADIRAFREAQFGALGWRCRFPLWQQATDELAATMSRALGGIICAVDGEHLGADWLGRRFDTALLEALPESVDPCGENGEFQTLVSQLGYCRLIESLPASETRLDAFGRPYLAWPELEAVRQA